MFRLILSILSLLIIIFHYTARAETTDALDKAHKCFADKAYNFSEVLNCYKQAQATKPLQYTTGITEQLAGVKRRQFHLTSQHWSPNGLVKEAKWQHQVNIYLPDHAITGRALLIANNGISHPNDKERYVANPDINENMAYSIAKQTRTIVVVINNIPNQYLTYTDDQIARREDDSVAHSWKLFLAAPQQRPFISLHIPMMASLVKAMDLAQRELKPWKINHFIATGVSKRAWSVWLAAIADARIDAIVPVAMDLLNIEKALLHANKVYAKGWPLAFMSYYQEGITKQFNQPDNSNLNRLWQIEDPLQYLNSAYANRLAIPKYIINASSDEFFLPDNAHHYLAQLPGYNLMRVVPNANHGSVRDFITEALIKITNRLQNNNQLPTVTAQLQSDGDGRQLLALNFSEKPASLIQWTATNPAARDFRYPCGVRYQSNALIVADRQNLKTVLIPPHSGWSASFIEATLADGLVITTPVYITPNTYPTVKPAGTGFCQTIFDK